MDRVLALIAAHETELKILAIGLASLAFYYFSRRRPRVTFPPTVAEIPQETIDDEDDEEAYLDEEFESYLESLQKDPDQLLSMKEVTTMLASLGVHVSKTLLREIFNKSQQNLHQSQSGLLSFGELSLCARNLSHVVRKRRSTMSSLIVPREPVAYQVFLGGSCNPTTWRRDVAIPYLTERQITFYNPQVDDWTPDLVEIEENAKANAALLFFVLDNQTRGVASMVEIAYLAATGRHVVVVITDFEEEVTMDGATLTQREIQDINRGRDFLCHCMSLTNVSLFDDLTVALEFSVALIQGTPLPHYPMSSVPLSEEISSLLINSYSSFVGYDHLKTKLLSVNQVRLATTSFGCEPVSEQQARQLLNIKEEQSSDEPLINYPNFCMFLSHFVPPTRETSFKDVKRRVFLGGSCGPVGDESDWRKNIAIPILLAAGISFFNPNVTNWTPSRIKLEHEAKIQSEVVVVVINGCTRAVASLVEAAHFIGDKRKMFLVIQKIHEKTVIDGHSLSSAEAKDFNRGRFYLADVANRNNIPVFDDISACMAALVNSLASNS